MGKFRLRLKLTGLEVEIDGDREDLGAIRSAAVSQFAGAIEPVLVAADGDRALPEAAKLIDSGGARQRPRGRGSRVGGSRGAAAGESVEFRHEPARFGNPLQTWSVSDKCIWLLYVLKSLGAATEASGPQIVATFNKEFKLAGRLHPPVVARELTKLKGANPAAVAQNGEAWYLLDAGERRAKELLQSVLSGSQ